MGASPGPGAARGQVAALAADVPVRGVVLVGLQAEGRRARDANTHGHLAKKEHGSKGKEYRQPQGLPHDDGCWLVESSVFSLDFRT